MAMQGSVLGRCELYHVRRTDIMGLILDTCVPFMQSSYKLPDRVKMIRDAATLALLALFPLRTKQQLAELMTM